MVINERIESIRSSPETTEPHLIVLREIEMKSLTSRRDLIALMGAFHHRSIRMFDVSLETMTRRVASIFNISSLSEILGDTNEVVGRVVASLYNLHFDDATDAAFPLTEEDLVFLERFTFQGKPLFKKGIARYRVAGKLVSQGLDPREIEYATQYVFEGVEYNWPEAAINIQGVIPMKLSDQD